MKFISYVKAGLITANIFNCTVILTGEAIRLTLRKAENNCSGYQYDKVLSSEKFDQSTLNVSLHYVIRQCYNSGRLSSLIKSNIKHGGQITPHGYYKSGEYGGWTEYSESEYPLQELTSRVKDESEDTAESVKQLVEHGDPSLCESLNLAAEYAKAPVVNMLLKAIKKIKIDPSEEAGMLGSAIARTGKLAAKNTPEEIAQIDVTKELLNKVR